MTLQVRPFQIQDSSQVLELIGQVWREFGILESPDESPDLLDIDRNYKVGRGNFWVANIEGRIIGTLGLKDVGSRRAVLKRMYVLDSFRGPRFTTAADLIRSAVQFANSSGVHQIFLGTPEFTKRAQRFYTKSGFQVLCREALPSNIAFDSHDSCFFVLNIEGFQASPAIYANKLPPSLRE
jgi:N-acetylglutamate synthase-like GNAT family acetyltransferase